MRSSTSRKRRPRIERTAEEFLTRARAGFVDVVVVVVVVIPTSSFAPGTSSARQNALCPRNSPLSIRRLGELQTDVGEIFFSDIALHSLG